MLHSTAGWIEKNIKITKINCKRSSIFVRKIATLLVRSAQQNVIALNENSIFFNSIADIKV